MADDADGFAAGVQRVKGIQRRIKRLGVQRAEALIQKQRIDAGFMAHQIRERQRQRETHQEAFAAGKRAGVAHRVRLPGVDDFQFQILTQLAFKQVAAMQARQLVIGEPYQIIQRQPLCELTEFIAFLRADQMVELAPFVGLAPGLVNLAKKRCQLRTALFILA